MTSNTLVAVVAASLIAFVCLIIIIAFAVWRCRSIKKKPPENGFYSNPTLLMQCPPMLIPAELNQKPPQPQDTVYAVPMPEQINPKRASLISTQQTINDKRPQNMWHNSDSVQIPSHSFVWRPKENKSGLKDVQENKAVVVENIQETVSDRQRKPHKGSIRYLPSRRF